MSARTAACVGFVVGLALTGAAFASLPVDSAPPEPEPTVTPAPAPTAVPAAEPGDTPVPTATPEPAVTETPTIAEDDPSWDCRTMGNRVCGVSIMGDWYVVSFDESGAPVGVARR